ncbi:MAG: hypothetical protein GY711_15805 [bacterium]|nr:hypothetical protein [bacterium]
MEFVYVVPRERLFPASYPHGLTTFGVDCDEAAFHDCVAEDGFFVERDYAERTPSLKQLIPYTVVMRPSRNAEGDFDTFCLRRTRQGGERRLHDKLSIGVGGHINPVDLNGEGSEAKRNLLRAATNREVCEEELSIGGDFELRTIGLLNDDSNSVGAVHVGVVQVLTTDSPVEVRETNQLIGQFTPTHELRAQREGGANFETWSSLLLGDLDRFTPQTIAS